MRKPTVLIIIPRKPKIIKSGIYESCRNLNYRGVEVLWTLSIGHLFGLDNSS